MKLAVMQPYFFPYLGYFQLLHASDVFVFYDDVNYINRGWINRNRILINGRASYITVPLVGASQNKKIYEIEIDQNAKWRTKMLRSIEMAYKKAPYFDQVYPIIREVIELDTNQISILAVQSVKEVCKYLGLKRKIEISSLRYPQTLGLGRSERIMEIAKLNEFTLYINAPGGENLYEKRDFLMKGIKLKFIYSNRIEYRQFKNEFVSKLSVIDTLMFNSKSLILSYLNLYKLI